METCISGSRAISFSYRRPDPTRPARCGRLTTPHGSIDTPAFLVGGARAAAQSLLPDEVSALGAQAMLCQTYHLVLRPGADVLADLGGLHRFMGWSGPLVTDSGGHQVFSLPTGANRASAKRAAPTPDDQTSSRVRRQQAAVTQARIVKIDDDGVTYRSYLDGSTQRLTPESSIMLQERLGADIIQALVEPIAASHDDALSERALRRTIAWAERALAARRRPDQALFGVVTGPASRHLCEARARALSDLGFHGFAIVHAPGETRREFEQTLAWSIPALPPDQPRHASGPGDPASLFRGVGLGADLFDSDDPVREAKRGVLLTANGPLTITKLAYREDDGPVDPHCRCPTCRTFSRAYLRHLFKADELLAATLAITHNLTFILSLMARIRTALAAGTFEQLKDETLAAYAPQTAAHR